MATAVACRLRCATCLRACACSMSALMAFLSTETRIDAASRATRCAACAPRSSPASFRVWLKRSQAASKRHTPASRLLCVSKPKRNSRPDDDVAHALVRAASRLLSMLLLAATTLAQTREDRIAQAADALRDKVIRSEERRVGKEGRTRRAREHGKKKTKTRRQ